MEKQTYTPTELAQLQEVLYEILAEVKRICDKHRIAYFITGGTAIGAHFWEGIIPWDDDIDVGMTRPNYERFMKIAPTELGDRYFLQTPESDPHVPFFFAKVRKNGTEFSESQFQHIHMHQGVYVDIFPFDKIPPSPKKEMCQHKLLYFLNGLFIAKEIWQWKYCGRCEVETPRERGFLPCLGTRILITILPKRLIYRMMCLTQQHYNHTSSTICKNIITKSERLPVSDAEHPQTVKLGPLQVSAPRNLLGYLLSHYGTIQKDYPEELRVSHKPARLKL